MGFVYGAVDNLDPIHESRPQISQWPRRLIDWLCGGRADYREFRERKAGLKHRSRRTLCLWIWLGTSALMLIFPVGGCLILLILGATFLSFTILDES